MQSGITTPYEDAYATIAGSLPPQIVNTLNELFGADLPQWHFIIDLFCQTATQDLGHLEAAIIGGDDSAIADVSHRIVGSARMLGHEPIGNAARVLERLARTAGPYRVRLARMEDAFSSLRALVDEFRLHTSRYEWPDA